jgi:hypothetical protein
MATTAIYRKLALEAANDAKFKLAASYYALAIKNYPSPFGELAKEDLRRLEEARKACIKQ